MRAFEQAMVAEPAKYLDRTPFATGRKRYTKITQGSEQTSFADVVAHFSTQGGGLPLEAEGMQRRKHASVQNRYLHGAAVGLLHICGNGDLHAGTLPGSVPVCPLHDGHRQDQSTSLQTASS